MKTAAASCAILNVARGLPPVSTLFVRRLGVDRQRMHGARKLPRQGRIDHAMAFDPGLPFERFRHDINPEMRFAARPVAGMALMQVRFVLNVEAFGRESFTQFAYDSVPCAHGGGINSVAAVRQWRREKRYSQCQDLKRRALRSQSQSWRGIWRGQARFAKRFCWLL